MAEEIAIVISAPSDVQSEYEQLVEEIESLQVLAKAYGFTLSYRSWQKDGQPKNKEFRLRWGEAAEAYPEEIFCAHYGWIKRVALLHKCG